MAEELATENITNIRCDGVVEYCYEYFGIQLQSTMDELTYEVHWDISSTEDCPYHNAGAGFSPKNLATNYMSKRSSTAF